MKRPLITPPDDTKMKKIKHQEGENESKSEPEVLEPGSDLGTGFVSLDENLLYEVMKHADAKTLGRAACVSKQWHRTAQDERLWELICTKHWANFGCGTQQLRSVVLALGGFRRLHSQYLWPLSKPNSNSNASSSGWAPCPAMIGSKQPARRWGKDEVHLSLSLLSIRYYEKMHFSNRGR